MHVLQKNADFEIFRIFVKKLADPLDSISSFEKIFDTKCDFWIFKSLKFCMICDWLEVKKLTIHQFLIGNVAINERKPLKIFSKYFQLICYNSSAVGGASEKRF